MYVTSKCLYVNDKRLRKTSCQKKEVINKGLVNELLCDFFIFYLFVARLNLLSSRYLNSNKYIKLNYNQAQNDLAVLMFPYFDT